MNENDIRQQSIDGAAEMLVGSFPDLAPLQWLEFAGNNHGRTADVYSRCADLAAARRALREL